MVTAIIVDIEEKIDSELRNVFLKRASVKKNKLSNTMVLEKILAGNPFKLGHILLDLHETFHVVPQYQPLTEFEHFKTVGDIKEYLLKHAS
ncbi:hypothetical protein U8V72_11380 [Priestia filamentosa]|uniref:hypothetical protein n=1 Tax=Priestia filamentosa TaxID=1402861 RepID=UPI00397A32C7